MARVPRASGDEPESLADDLKAAFLDMGGDAVTPEWLSEIASSLASDKKLAYGFMLQWKAKAGSSIESCIVGKRIAEEEKGP